MPGTHRESERTIEFAGQMADRANVPLRVEVGDPARSGAYHPHLSLGWRPGGDAREDEPGILRIGFADLGSISQAIPDTREATGLTIVGANATARLYMPRADRLHFDLTIDAATLRNRYTVGTEIRIPYDLTGGRGLAWYYQTPLLNSVDIGGGRIEGNDPQTLETVQRPRAMDGGYAVYHTSIRNDRNDGFGNWRLAGSGKICNVERPRAIHGVDTIWGRIEVAGGQLTLVFDAADFRNRVGPVVIDPDVGYTSIGATAQVSANRQTASGWFVMPEAGDASSMTIYCAESGANWTMGIWSDNGSQTAPTTLLEETAGGALTATDWRTQSLNSTLSLTASQEVWLGFNQSTNRNGRYDATSGGVGAEWYQETSHTYSAGTLANMAGGGSTADRVISLYFTYTATGGGGGGTDMPWPQTSIPVFQPIAVAAY